MILTLLCRRDRNGKPKARDERGLAVYSPARRAANRSLRMEVRETKGQFKVSRNRMAGASVNRKGGIF
jgi:hypothetical protein